MAALIGCADLTCTFSSAGTSDPDGTGLTYAWTFGDADTSTVANPSHTYGSSGNRNVTLTVTDPGGLSDSASVTATPSDPVPGNDSPTARFTFTCDQLACDFDGSTSSDPEDGDVTSYAWTFQGGGTASTATPSHTFPAPGTYDVTLTVRDSENAAGSVTHPVAVSVPVSSDLDFRGAATDKGNVTSAPVPAPAGMQAGDTLLLFASSNKGQSPSETPDGWTFVTDQVDAGGLRTTLYRRTAPGGGSLGTVSWPSRNKTNLTVLAYSGADPVPPR